MKSLAKSLLLSVLLAAAVTPVFAGTDTAAKRSPETKGRITAAEARTKRTAGRKQRTKKERKGKRTRAAGARKAGREGRKASRGGATA
ncbi:MAG: hypothetical protein H6679_04005 [Epsilonproteobacteria bacterium]|nr:hypothetical protein [Campylobacterota bacterium]